MQMKRFQMTYTPLSHAYRKPHSVLNKVFLMPLVAMGVLTPALALTGCGSTKPRSVTTTPPLVISACPAIPPDLLQLPLKPPMPRSGEPQALLTHASRYGQWSQELEQKLLAIKALVDKQQGKQNEQTD